MEDVYNVVGKFKKKAMRLLKREVPVGCVRSITGKVAKALSKSNPSLSNPIISKQKNPVILQCIDEYLDSIGG